MGSGGTGGYFGGLLARAGEDVTFIARGAHLAALRGAGLTITSRLKGEFTVPVTATDNPKAVGSVDLILFCVKAYDTGPAAEAIRPLVGLGTTVLPLQNGIDAAEHLGAVVGTDHVVGGVAFITSSVIAPGTVAQTGGPGKIIAGEPAGGDSPRIDRLLRTLDHAGIAVQSSPAIQIDIWEKFVFICAFGGLTALTRLPIGPVLASRECRALFEGVMQEVITVAAVQGIDLPAGTLERGTAMAAGFEPWARGSLLHDLESGRRMELETLNGTVVRLARVHGLAVPYNSVVYAALQPYVDGSPPLPNAMTASP